MVALVEPRRPFIDGKYVPGDGPSLAVENPATEETIAEVETASTEQIEQAIGAARPQLRRRRVERACPPASAPRSCAAWPSTSPTGAISSSTR